MVQRIVQSRPWRHRPSTLLLLCSPSSTVTALARSLPTTGIMSVSSMATKQGTFLTFGSRLLIQRSILDRRLLSSATGSPASLLRKNEVDVQMLHPELHDLVFPKSKSALAHDSTNPTPEMVQCAISHLEKQNLWGKEAILVPDTAFPVPELRGQTIEDHFYNIGLHEVAPYREIAVQFAQSSTIAPPKKWILQPGWTRYGNDGSLTQVAHPQEKALTFDVETVPGLSKYPVMACAVSSEAWYGWVSPWLIDPEKNGLANDQHLLPFGKSQNLPGQERVLVGHNVGYDRARVLEEYSLELNGIRYLDTMSLHIAGSGLCTQQRPNWLKYSKAVENENEAYVEAFKDTTGKYFDVSAVNSLMQVAKFHCDIRMDKAPRNILMEATQISTIQENFQELMTYCGHDVVATHAVFQKTFPKFLDTCPHPVSLAGVLQMGSSFLTVNEGWTAYLNRCGKLYQEMTENVESKLLLLANNALENFERDPKFYADDPWLSQMDWEPPKRRWKEGVPLVSGKGWRKGQEPRWICGTKLLPDKPEWYRSLWDTSSKRVKMTTRQRIAPLLLKLQWRGFPLVHSSQHGWTFRVPMDNQDFVTKAAPLTFPAENKAGHQPIIQPDHYRYYRLPHKSGDGANVGNPLAKSYIPYFEENVLSSFAAEGESTDDSGRLARQALDMNAQCAYWVSARERIEEQFVVWDKSAKGAGPAMGLPDRGEGRLGGMIMPQIITMGTVTRRAVEKTWMTASNAKKNRIGSELKSMVQAPAGYKIVGADVDSEELWISSLMGDAQFKMHGATALGWMTLQGTKAAGTDLHSKTAQILGISRDQAKVFNYGRIYGAGLKFAARLLQQFNTSIDGAEAKLRANNLYTATKGTKQHKEPEYSLVTDRPFWHGGTESYMFNSLERTATADDPRTPALGCGITDALKPKHTENQFMTSRVNWVVQSSGVDYLHLLLVSMNYLIKKYDIQARFMLCVHDEVRYMVKEEDSARATLALQVSNLWTRALFSYKLGIHDLPQSVAFFSCVDVDHVFRKEVFMDCLTPTQREPIPHGKSLTIEDVLDLTDGGKLGDINPEFKEAGEASFPFELRTAEERLRIQNAERSLEGSAVSTSNIQEADEKARSTFLQAQSMATMKEIKKYLKQQKADELATFNAKIAAEKKAASAASGGQGSGSGQDGQGGGSASVLTSPAAKLARLKSAPKRQIRDATPANGKKAMTGSWGVVKAPKSKGKLSTASAGSDFVNISPTDNTSIDTHPDECDDVEVVGYSEVDLSIPVSYDRDSILPCQELIEYLASSKEVEFAEISETHQSMTDSSHLPVMMSLPTGSSFGTNAHQKASLPVGNPYNEIVMGPGAFNRSSSTSIPASSRSGPSPPISRESTRTSWPARRS